VVDVRLVAQLTTKETRRREREHRASVIAMNGLPSELEVHHHVVPFLHPAVGTELCVRDPPRIRKDGQIESTASPAWPRNQRHGVMDSFGSFYRFGSVQIGLCAGRIGGRPPPDR